jgi:hypothetical protein
MHTASWSACTINPPTNKDILDSEYCIISGMKYNAVTELVMHDDFRIDRIFM